jgi:amino acid adenylation domain-containing protein
MSARYANEAMRTVECQGPETLFDESLVAKFERVASSFASRTALGSDAWEATYCELNETANRIAHRLIADGAAPGDRAAILMAHDTPMVAAVLGALKAGQIVVALSPQDPVARLTMLVEDTEPGVIITDGQNQRMAMELAPSDCNIVHFEPASTTGPIKNPAIEIKPGQTAFLTYTSGTTGRPKGVMKTHRQLCRGAAARSEALRYTENDRAPLFALVSTGQGTTGLWMSLLNGAMLCPFPVNTKGVTGLADWILDRGLTVYASSASIFRTLISTIDEGLVFSKVRAVRLSSEAVTADDFRAFRKHFPPNSVLVHGLSSSETSSIACSRWTQNDNIPEGVLPVGHFSRDIDISLVGDDGQPVARGEIGEIVVTSRYLAAGYWRDPALTASRFSADLDGEGTRQVRTGDLGRIDADGRLSFCGRKDDRIKIRGNRIELLDIERTLEKLPGIDRAAAIAIPRENSEPMLVAFVVKKRNASWTPAHLRNAVRANLPPHMVPSRMMFLDALPYNRGNKIDREALRKHSLALHADTPGEKPRTDTETAIADLWAEALDLPDLGRDDDFFELGGDSLKGAVVAAQVHAILGIELTLGAIADHPTVATLAAFIDKRMHTDATLSPPIVRVPRTPVMQSSLFQEGLWDYCQGSEDKVVTSRRVSGPLDVEILKECLTYLFQRHEILRTTFRLDAGHLVQIVHSSAPPCLSVVDLIDAENAQDQADLILRQIMSQPVDLTALPIMRYVLMRLAKDVHRLIRISNPIINDGFASRIFNAELAALYEARLQGLPPPFPKEAPLHYADFAVWQRELMPADGAYVQEALSWWKDVLSPPPPPIRLPTARLRRRTGLDVGEGTLRWKLEEKAARRLDAVARSAGTTYFTARLAAFAALMADVSGNATVVIGTWFDNRDRMETRNIIGRFSNFAFLVLTYDPRKTFLEWLEIVRDRVYETKMRSGLPHHRLLRELRVRGIKPPTQQLMFTVPADYPDRPFGELTFDIEYPDPGRMSRGCRMYVSLSGDGVMRFDAAQYNPNGMRALLDRYMRLLEAAASDPELPIGRLQIMIGAKAMHWALQRRGLAMYEFIRRWTDRILGKTRRIRKIG